MPLEDITYELWYRDGRVVCESDGVVGAFRDAAADPTFDALYIIEYLEERARVVCRDGMRPIFARRFEQVISMDGQPGGQRLRRVLYGFQKTVNGRNVQCLTILHDDGRVVLTDRATEGDG